MSKRRTQSLHRATLLGRGVVALWLAALVLALGAAAHSPLVHEWFCDHDHNPGVAQSVATAAPGSHANCCGHGPASTPEPEPTGRTGSGEGCAVDLFAQGFAPGAVALSVGIPETLAAGTVAIVPETERPIAPRYTLRPLRGPPTV